MNYTKTQNKETSSTNKQVITCGDKTMNIIIIDKTTNTETKTTCTCINS